MKGLTTYGSDEINKRLQELENPIFICTTATTETSNIPGISGAGASPELTKFTPAADAELILDGEVKCMESIPETVVEGDAAPTPSMLTKASVDLCKPALLILDAGTEIKPQTDKLTLSEHHGKNIATGKAVCDAEDIFQKAFDLGRTLSDTQDYIVIGETIAAGTTTALGVLIGLGYDAWGKVSGSMPTNPHDLKNETVKAGLENAGITPSKDNDPFDVIAAVGDPMLPAVAGVAMGAEVPVVLAGGTQLASACAIIKALNPEFDFSNICLATTSFVVKDETADLLDIVSQIGDITVNAVNPCFEKARYGGLKNYLDGFVKEGAGAGGAMFLALMMGHDIDEVREAIDEYCSK